jgi:valyl-tRNA synthetase
MTNIRDWTISRQLWWGHRIPVFYCDACGWMDAMHENPGTCPVCGAKNVRQDEDVLDTWFSSWLWPFSVHHWPVDSADLRSFYPTTLLVTAPDIIFFWVARMIMAGIEFMPGIPLPDGGQRKELKDLIPFTDVYFTSIIRDEQGRKMSKSLGNSPDPLVVIDNYSADALRFTVMYLAPLGQDLLFSENKCEIGRNFANKIWNAGRFLLMNKAKCASEGTWDEHAAAGEAVELEDKWILSRLNSTLAELATCMEKYRINDAAKLLYDFIWHDFCDWYIELIKERLYADDPAVRINTVRRALGIFETILTMLHPIMPFITEELWHRIVPGRDGSSIMNALIPKSDPGLIDDAVCEAMNYLQSVVEQVRTVRGEMNVPPSRYCNVLINCHDARRIDIVLGNKHFLERLARIESVDAGQGLRRPRLSAVAVVAGDEVFIPLEGLIDIELERARVRKEMNRIQGLLKGIEAKLANGKFTANAPADVVEKEKAKRENFAVTLMKLSASLGGLEEEA